MSAEVIDLVSEDAVDRAWDELVRHRIPLMERPDLLLDRTWSEQDARLHSRFVQLFMASEPPCPVFLMRPGR